jgi:hypothetical protein
MRNLAHKTFDPLWQRGRMSRAEAYAWMRRTMGLTAEQAHIGRFGHIQCRALINAVADQRRSLAVVR